MKKSYIQPKMQVVELKSRVSLLTASTLNVSSETYDESSDWEDL